LLAWDSNVWIVDGQPMIVNDTTTIEGQKVLGATVSANGHLDDRGEHVADRVALAPGPVPASTLPETTVSGTLTGIDGHTWKVAEARVILPTSTDAVTARVGNIVTITGWRLPDGTVIAKSIVVSLPADGASPVASETTAPAPSAAATPTQAPSPTAIPSPTATRAPEIPPTETEQHETPPEPTATPKPKKEKPPKPEPEATATPVPIEPVAPEVTSTQEDQGKPHRGKPKHDSSGNGNGNGKSDGSSNAGD
jgi:hypothetical protein